MKEDNKQRLQTQGQILEKNEKKTSMVLKKILVKSIENAKKEK